VLLYLFLFEMVYKCFISIQVPSDVSMSVSKIARKKIYNKPPITVILLSMQLTLHVR